MHHPSTGQLTNAEDTVIESSAGVMGSGGMLGLYGDVLAEATRLSSLCARKSCKHPAPEATADSHNFPSKA